MATWILPLLSLSVLVGLASSAGSGSGATSDAPSGSPSPSPSPSPGPRMGDLTPYPVHVYEGEDALITCVVRDVGDNSVQWKRRERERWQVLTAGTQRITADKRFSVLHDEGLAFKAEDEPTNIQGGDVWVLVIVNTTRNDSKVYRCEVNGDPPVQSFHPLQVLPREQDTKSDDETSALESRADPNHNYTDCCIAANVSAGCLGFCNIQSILDGNTGKDPQHCEADFPAVVRCMADGRNHVPCCVREGVPDICRDVCRGDYTVITDNIKTHFSCSQYTEQTLACIVEGVDILPGPPREVTVDEPTPYSVKVRWEAPMQLGHTVTKYVINVTRLRWFEDSNEPKGPAWSESQSSAEVIAVKSRQVTVDAAVHEVLVDKLEPFTMYEITVTSMNSKGTSLASPALRAITQTHYAAWKQPLSANTTTPTLPDIKGCCEGKNVSQYTRPNCLNKLCDPHGPNELKVTDMMVCAPWATQAFECLANGKDHTPCCRARGLPKICLDLCSGDVKSFDVNYFRCLRYMPEYTSCLLTGYGVIPSQPTRVYISNVDVNYAIVHWDPPQNLSESVTSYYLSYQRVSKRGAPLDLDFTSVEVKRSPYILENLQGDTMYEILIEASNAHGLSEPSTRVVFKTKSELEVEEIEEARSPYNLTSCCVAAQLAPLCMPLCSYNANMTDLKRLGDSCGAEFHKLLRCGAGGRNHGGCCSRRGVPNVCLPLCSGVLGRNLTITGTTCVPFIGNIVQCYEEGTGSLPGPVVRLQAIGITNQSVTFTWEPPNTNDSTPATSYIVNYQRVAKANSGEQYPIQKITVQATNATVTGLQTNELYNIFVVSKNGNGTSLPSSVLLVNITDADNRPVNGVTSPPHSLTVPENSATWMTVSWQPPEISHPTERIVYHLFYKESSKSSSTNFTQAETTATTLTLRDLEPNTKYIIFLEAISAGGASAPSETLLAWTDPAYPPFVEPPTVHPVNLVIEGNRMTILCIAMGTPTPTISLYISGRLVHQKQTRHMVTLINNVTRDMDQISCYADNGYGTPMQASRRITISHAPSIVAAGITMAVLGDSVTLECAVSAHPEPKMLFWRDPRGRVPVIQGGANHIDIQKAKDEMNKWIMQLTINKIAQKDEGEYYCHAENAFGSATQPVSVRIRNVPFTTNVTQCCVDHSVSPGCLDICSLGLDLDVLRNKPTCESEFDKLMKCASDGSDHRNCCSRWGVPRMCMDWCRGEPLQDSEECIVSYSKQILSCFHENKERLPGPPQKVEATVLDAQSVKISWQPPLKNPGTVQLYRVFYREVGAKTALKSDSVSTSVVLNKLKKGATYECVVKAGNSEGTSHLTEPIQFVVEKYITSASSIDDNSSHVGVAVGVVLAVLAVLGLLTGVVWFLKSRQLLGRKHPGGVAFENPSYLRELNMDHMQVPQPQQGDNQTATVQSNGNGNSATNPVWRQETLHVPAPSAPTSTEVAPSLYEELKLGQDGAGFRRLKP